MVRFFSFWPLLVHFLSNINASLSTMLHYKHKTDVAKLDSSSNKSCEEIKMKEWPVLEISRETITCSTFCIFLRLITFKLFYFNFSPCFLKTEVITVDILNSWYFIHKLMQNSYFCQNQYHVKLLKFNQYYINFFSFFDQLALFFVHIVCSLFLYSICSVSLHCSLHCFLHFTSVLLISFVREFIELSSTFVFSENNQEKTPGLHNINLFNHHF